MSRIIKNTDIVVTIPIIIHFKIEKILDKMIFAFNAALYNDWKAPKEYLEKYESEKEALQKYNEDIQEGLNLFAKHYFDLWW